MQWSQSKAPKTKSEYYGSNYVLVENFIDSFYTHPLSNILILSGPPGVGKTCLIKLIAEEKGMGTFYSDGSNNRDMDAVKEIYKQTLTGRRRLIILDEAENIPAKSMTFLAEKKKKFIHPLVIICNDSYQIKSDLKKEAWEITFNEPTKFDLELFTDKFIETNNLEFNKSIKKQVIENSRSFRGVINNLQIYQETGLLLKEYDGFNNIFDKVRGAVRGLPTDLNNEELFGWVASSTPNQQIASRVNVLMGYARNKATIGDSVNMLMRFCSLPERLTLFTRQSNDKDKSKTKKEKQIKIIAKKKIKTESVLEWI